MKITKVEKIWLAVVILFYVCYNLPFVPPYGNSHATIIHGLITLIPLWIAIYVGFFKICRIYKIKDSAGSETSIEENKDVKDTGEDTSC